MCWPSPSSEIEGLISDKSKNSPSTREERVEHIDRDANKGYMWYMGWRKLKTFSVRLYFLHDKGHRSQQLSVKVMWTFKPFSALLGAFLWRSGYKINRDCERQIIHINLQNNVLSISANLWDQCKFFHWSRSLKKKTIVFYLPNTRASFEYSAFLWGAALLRKRLLIVHTTCCSHAVWTALQSRHKADCSETGLRFTGLPCVGVHF